jgi:threonine/homoserine/homoserine lactone efflux protein
MQTSGGVYLIYLGVKSIMSARQNGRESAEKEELTAPRSGRARFVRAWAVTVLNPKSILFFIAFVPQFISHAAPFVLQAGILLPTFVLMAMINVSIYMSLTGMVGAKLSGAEAQRKVHYVGGGTLIAAGTLTLALKHR